MKKKELEDEKCELSKVARFFAAAFSGMALKLTKQLDRERSIRVFKYAVSLRWRFVEHKMCIFASLWTLTFATGFRSFPLYSLAVGRSYVFYALKPSRGPRTRPSYPTPALYFLTAHGVVIKHREIRAPELRSPIVFSRGKNDDLHDARNVALPKRGTKIESRFMRSTRRRTTRCSISKLLFFLFVFGWYFCIAMEKKCNKLKVDAWMKICNKTFGVFAYLKNSLDYLPRWWVEQRKMFLSQALYRGNM